jgi:DNA-directed RNA polymerase specialized sigma24 family protein
MVKQDQAMLQTKALNVRSLYDNYAAMLLGYIFEMVGDKNLAEDYLVKIFTDLAQNFNNVNWSQGNKWCLLQRYAKNQLAKLNTVAAGCHTPFGATGLPNKYLNEMTQEQALVFCSIYYQKKTAGQLAGEINKSEELVKKLLKEAFSIIRKSNEN